MDSSEKKKKSVFSLFNCTVTVSNLLFDIKKSLRLCLEDTVMGFIQVQIEIC